MQWERLQRVARALCLTPTDRLDIVLSRVGGRRAWWVVGCVEGDQALPQTGAARTVDEALDAAEAWLAPELDATSASKDCT